METVELDPTQEPSRRVFGGVLSPAPKIKGGQPILYSLLTIGPGMPKLLREPCGDAVVMHEDDWLQTEFFSERDRDHVQQMMLFLRANEPRMREGYGFNAMYVRDELPTPMRNLQLSLSSLRQMLACATPARGLALAPASGAGQLVDGGFAIELPGGGFVYGQADGDKIVALGMEADMAKDKPSPEAAHQLSEFADANHLLLAAWAATVALKPARTESIWKWPLLDALEAPAKVANKPWWKFW